MSAFFQSIKENYSRWNEGKHAYVDSWFLMGSPSVILGLWLAYLVFVLKLGPAIMKNRPPMTLRKTLIVYNGLQVVFSLYLVYKSFSVLFTLSGLFSNSCTNNNPKITYSISDGGWWYFMAKLSEYMDTIFFVLRKKNGQISFLHVYHHSLTMVGSWGFLKYSSGEPGVIVGAVNSTVHVVMYFYYMVAAMGPAYQKYIWWKKYMTIMQLVQFAIILTYISFLSLSSCGHSRTLSFFFISNTIVFLYLFADFYMKSYKKPAKKAAVNGANGFSHNNNNDVKKNARPEEDIFKKYLQDEPYAQISKDASYLDQDSLRKRE